MVKLGGNLGNFSLKICQSMEFGLCTWESWVKIENLSTEVSRWERRNLAQILLNAGANFKV